MGGSVTHSNFEVFCEQFYNSRGKLWCTINGAYGSNWILIRTDKPEESKEIFDFLEGLENFAFGHFCYLFVSFIM